MKNWSQLILQKMPDKISASQFLLVLLTLDSNLYHIFYTISFYTIIVQKNRTLFHKLFPLESQKCGSSFLPFFTQKKAGFLSFPRSATVHSHMPYHKVQKSPVLPEQNCNEATPIFLLRKIILHIPKSMADRVR